MPEEQDPEVRNVYDLDVGMAASLVLAAGDGHLYPVGLALMCAVAEEAHAALEAGDDEWRDHLIRAGAEASALIMTMLNGSVVEIDGSALSPEQQTLVEDVARSFPSPESEDSAS
ncbi:MAG: hypothetical protein HKN01_01420 [Acidimicrobiia bacterium]|nr:hypothetical protein [Acidimicrobiia bacterium]